MSLENFDYYAVLGIKPYTPYREAKKQYWARASQAYVDGDENGVYETAIAFSRLTERAWTYPSLAEVLPIKPTGSAYPETQEPEKSPNKSLKHLLERVHHSRPKAT